MELAPTLSISLKDKFTSCKQDTTRVTWLAFTQPQSRILGQHWVLKSVNSVLSPAFGNRFQESFQICVARWVFVYKYKGSVDAQFYKAGLR